MSNHILTTTNSKLDTRVKEPSGVVPPPSGVGLGPTLDRFNFFKLRWFIQQINNNCTDKSNVKVSFVISRLEKSIVFWVNLLLI